jgi:hypothetical protein
MPLVVAVVSAWELVAKPDATSKESNNETL